MNQFAVYRVKDQTKAPWQLSYFAVLEQKIAVRENDYQQIYLNHAEKWKNAMEIWHHLQKSIKVSDVLVVNQSGEISAYYMDSDGPHKLSGFIAIHSEGAVIDADTKDYQIDGYEGSWQVVDYIIINGQQFYLLEHQKFQEQANKVILDRYGTLITETGKAGFDEAAKQKIRDYEKKEEEQKPVREDHQERLERYQKMLLQKGKEHQGNSSGGKSISENNTVTVMGEKAVNGKKTSIVRRLHRHQAEIAKKEGKPVSKYLAMELEREKNK